MSFHGNESLLIDYNNYLKNEGNEVWKNHSLIEESSFSYHALQALCLAGFVSIITLLMGILPGNSSTGNFWPLFVPDYYGSRASAHLFDPYSFLHVGHGILSFYAWGILDNVHEIHFKSFQKSKSAFHSWWLREGGLIKAMFMAMAFELVENSSGVIEIFRANSGVSEDYVGDSSINVIGDLISSAFGYNLSRFFVSRGYTALPLLIFILEEITLAYLIRDGMILILLQTFFPSDKIRNWQSSIIDNKSIGLNQYQHLWIPRKFDKYNQYLRKIS